MQNNSQATMIANIKATCSTNKLKNSKLKYLLLSSGLAAAVLSGCQTTTGIHSSPTDTSAQTAKPGTPAFGQSSATDQPDTTTQITQPDPDSSQPTQADNPFESDDDTGGFSPVFTQTPEQSEPNNQPDYNNSSYPSSSETVTPPSVQQPSLPQIPTRPLPSSAPSDTRTAKQILIEQARQNSKRPTVSKSTVEDGDNLPAFRSLMSKGEAQLRQGQISAAQSTFTRAQRLAPQSSAVYFYLGQVALKQNQPLKAEAMARRGLVVAKTASRKTALWQVILKAGQAQGNQRVVNEARAALSR